MLVPRIAADGLRQKTHRRSTGGWLAFDGIQKLNGVSMYRGFGPVSYSANGAVSAVPSVVSLYALG